MRCGCMRASTVGCRVLDRCGDSLGVLYGPSNGLRRCHTNTTETAARTCSSSVPHARWISRKAIVLKICCKQLDHLASSLLVVPWEPGCGRDTLFVYRLVLLEQAPQQVMRRTKCLLLGIHGKRTISLSSPWALLEAAPRVGHWHAAASGATMHRIDSVKYTGWITQQRQQIAHRCRQRASAADPLRGPGRLRKVRQHAGLHPQMARCTMWLCFMSK